MPTFLTVKQTADLLQVHPDTVRLLLRQGDLVGFRVGHQFRVDSSKLDSYLAAHMAVDA